MSCWRDFVGYGLNLCINPIYHDMSTLDLLKRSLVASHLYWCPSSNTGGAEVRFWDVYEDVHFLYVVPGLEAMEDMPTSR